MVEVICEMKIGQQCQITDFFWMRHPTSTYSSVQSATKNQDNNYGFPSSFPHIGLK